MPGIVGTMMAMQALKIITDLPVIAQSANNRRYSKLEFYEDWVLSTIIVF